MTFVDPLVSGTVIVLVLRDGVKEVTVVEWPKLVARVVTVCVALVLCIDWDDPGPVL